MNLTPNEQHLLRKAINEKLAVVQAGFTAADFSGAQIFYRRIENDCRSILKKLDAPPDNLRNERLTRSVTLLLKMVRPQIEEALASGNVADEEKAMLRGQLEYFDTALNTP